MGIELMGSVRGFAEQDQPCLADQIEKGRVGFM